MTFIPVLMLQPSCGFGSSSMVDYANGAKTGKRYNWSFEARIPGGGFIWNEKDFDFTAPENGYRETIRLQYKADMPKEQWQRVISVKEESTARRGLRYRRARRKLKERRLMGFS